MLCAICQEPATASCTNCGTFTCLNHTVRHWGRGLCQECYQRLQKARRIVLVILGVVLMAAVVITALGISAAYR